MTSRRLRQTVAFASLAVVLTAAAVSRSDRWSFDFAQYKGEPRPEPKEEFRFVIVGDRTGGAQWGLMPQTFREINQLDPDFVISVGDIIDGGGSDPQTIHGIWDDFDRNEMPVLKVPFVYTPGNHDIWSALSKKVYEQRYGPSFKSFNYRGLHFITLNTQDYVARERQESGGADFRFRGRGPATLGEEQLQWLKEDIERNRHARRILIFMHQPIWSVLEPVYPLLEGLKVNVFAGHYHKYSYTEIRGIPHIICSATAAYMPEEGMEAYGRFRSYLLATVRDDDLKLALIRLGGVLNPKQIMEQDQTGVRQLVNACAIRRDSDDPAAPTRLVFRNPMRMPVRLQIARSTRTSSKWLFENGEPSTDAGAVLEKEIDWSSFARSGSGNIEYRVMYRFENSGGEQQTVDFPIEARVHRVAQAFAVSSPPEIDGELGDWSGARWQSIADRSQASQGLEAWQGPQDLSAQFAVADDASHVYLAVRVADDNVAFSSTMHESDSVELFLANPGEREISFSREDDWRRLIVAPFADGETGPTAGATPLRKYAVRGIWGGEAGSQEFPEGRAAFVRDAKQYVIEIALPRSALGWTENSTAFDLDIAINDRDSGGGRETRFTWCGNDGNAYSSSNYGDVRPATP
jgi:hypothetical protein